jgi:hypothetical protein
MSWTKCDRRCGFLPNAELFPPVVGVGVAQRPNHRRRQPVALVVGVGLVPTDAVVGQQIAARVVGQRRHRRRAARDLHEPVRARRITIGISRRDAANGADLGRAVALNGIMSPVFSRPLQDCYSVKYRRVLGCIIPAILNSKPAT